MIVVFVIIDSISFNKRKISFVFAEFFITCIYCYLYKKILYGQQIDALDPFEDLTELGHHLADLPVEPRFGKMILYSVVLKCLDPILTIACALAYKDPCMQIIFKFEKLR